MWRLFMLLIPIPALADSVVATRTLRAQTILAMSDLTAVETEFVGAISDPQIAVGFETKVAIYAGKPVRLADIGSPTVISRNQVVSLFYGSGGLNIQTEGRALDRGGVGDFIEVMNLNSRSKVYGQIGPDGAVRVAPAP